MVTFYYVGTFWENEKEPPPRFEVENSLYCYNEFMKGQTKAKGIFKKVVMAIFLIICLLIIFGIYKANFIDNNINKNIMSSEAKAEVSKVIDKPILSIYPQKIYQGDPLFISIHASSTPVSLTFNKKEIKFFKYKNSYLGIIGIDFNEKKLKGDVFLKLSNGMEISQLVVITAREKIERPLGIPEKLGGNTEAASQILMTNLAKENAELNTVKTENKNLWTKSFQAPVFKISITDHYGYNRKTVGQTIVHKGADFQAITGTPVIAMNDGVVRIAKEYIVYGNSIIIDHGLGVQTLYMHLSSLNVKAGDMVKAGQVIGLSGDTGYAEAPHLHISVKINTISIDPMTFLGFFGVK